MAKPRIRFPGFTEDWKKHRFGDLIVEHTEKTSDKDKYPLYSLTIENGVSPKSERYEREHLITKDGDAYKIVPPHAFVYNPMNLRFGALKASHEDFSVSVSGYYNVFSLKNESALGFWESYLVSKRMLSFYNSIATGSLEEKKRVHFSSFVDVEKEIPTPEEQTQIATFLSQVDDVISASEEEVANLVQLKKGMMQKIFSQEVRLKKDDGSEYPEWEKTTLGIETTPYLIRNKKKLPLDIYSINNVSGFVPQEEQFDNAGYLNEVDTSIYMIVPDKHFAYNPARINVGSIGYQNLGHDVQVSSLYEVFSTSEKIIDEFLWVWFHTLEFQKNIMRLQEGGVRQYFYYNKLQETPILLPCAEEQIKIAEFFSSMDEAIAAAREELEKYKELKKGLLQQMFV